MAIGERKRIQLLKAVSTKAVNGSWDNSRTRYTYWAEVVKGTGSRNYDNQTKLRSSYTFRVRYNGNLDINASWSVVYDGKQLTVTSISKDREKSFYWIIETSG